ncbi:MAG: DUF2812 domain-containing protein [Bacillota bacterium]|nr:DUF2812 domain-containing protein [Bacillota bacterium]
MTEIKKKFSILDLDQEEAFIEENASQGKIFQKVEDGVYNFEEGQAFKASCVIEYFKDQEGNSYFYENQGLDLVYSYKGKIGHWSYYLGPFKADLERRPDDRKELYQSIKRRNEIFWTIIPLSLLLFSLYMAYMTKNPYFFLLTIGSTLILNKGGKINKKIKDKEE